MPDVIREGTNQYGYPTIGVCTVTKSGEFWTDRSLKFWQTVLDNIDRIRQIVDRQEHPHGHDDKY
jgi:hypothetical protein